MMHWLIPLVSACAGTLLALSAAQERRWVASCAWLAFAALNWVTLGLWLGAHK